MSNRSMIVSMLLVYLLSWVLQGTPDPQFLATQDGVGQATVRWTQVTRGCLSVEHATGQRVFITCREKPGTQIVPLGRSQTDGAYRPTAGDVYVLQTGGQVYRAPLKWRRYLAVLAR